MTTRDTPDKDGFLTRWSRRKRGADPEEGDPAIEDAIPPSAHEPDTALPVDPERADEMAANRAAAEAVDLESIDSESDLSVFFKEGVPAVLKQAALRKMWRSDPVFANLDGLNDYDQDFNVIDKVLTEFKSAWQVGRGYATDADEDMAPAEREQTEAEPADAAEPGEPDPETEAAVAETPDGAAGEPEGEDQTGDMKNQPRTDTIGSPLQPAEDDVAAPKDDSGTVQEEPVRPTVSLRRRMQLFDDG